MTIGIIGAMEEEIQNILEDMSVHTTKNALGLDFHIGSINNSGNSLVLVRSGIGKVNAALCAQVLIDLFAVDMIINVGVAGAIDNKVKIGDIVISSDAVHHDFDTSALGDEVGIISRMDQSIFEADEYLISVATAVVNEMNITNYLGRIASGDQFICDKEAKEKIASLFTPLACEMEGAAIAHACHLNRVPFVIIRCISDNADEESEVNYDVFFKESAVIAGNIIKNMVTRIDNN